MELKPGYKQTEVGVIPEDWHVVRASDACLKIQDGTHFSPRLGGNDYLYITSKNIRFGHLDISSAQRISAAEHRAIYRRCDVKRGDLLLTKDGANTGNAALNTLDEEFSLLSSVAFLRFQPEKHSAAYFLQQILTSQGQSQIQDAMAGNAITRVTLEKIKKLRFPLPSTKNEQEAIATALNDVDALIGSLDQLIAKKRDLKQAAMQQLLTGKKRLPGFSGEWEVKWLKAACELITKGTTPTSLGKSFTSNGINFIKIETLEENGTVIREKVAFIDETTNKLLKRSQLRAKDILVSIAGALGRIAVVPTDILPANTNQALAIVRLKQSSKIDHGFLFYYLNSTAIKKHIEAINVQAAQANLSLENVGDFVISFPSLPEQTVIAAVLSDMDAEITALEQRLAKTRDLKQGMMQELLTGRIRLPLSEALKKASTP